ncbi:MAG: hypothetical protein HY746_04955 [Elusimicrobia bacterium]|nr:hypothetical protein [Elusimicrobiota bacterium]
MGIWKNAFKLPDSAPVTDEQKKMIEVFSRKIKERSMGHLAFLFLESTKPLHNIGSQSLTFLMPFISLIFKKEEAQKFAGIFENPNAVSFLIEQLEGKG